MRLIGIDPGTGITGFGVIDIKQQKPIFVDAGVIRTKAHTPLPERLAIIYNNVITILDETKPDVFIIEKLYFARNVTTAISVSHARGTLMLAAQQRGIEIAEYTPLQIKQTLTGYGRAEKKQVQIMVKTLLNLKDIPKPDDAADALATALCHLSHLKPQ